MQYNPKTGEIISKQELIDEILALLNRFNAKGLQSQVSSFDTHIIEALDMHTLTSIRNHLLDSEEKALQDFKQNLSKWDI